jgi:hypothetical protein
VSVSAASSRVRERKRYSAMPSQRRKMGDTARVRWCYGWMLKCAQQSTMARRERWEWAFGSGSAGLVFGLQGDGRPRLNRSKVSTSKKIGVLPSPCTFPFRILTPTTKNPLPPPLDPPRAPAHKLKQLRRALRELVDLRARGGVEDR